jgi:spore coat protein A, manganese oxidase
MAYTTFKLDPGPGKDKWKTKLDKPVFAKSQPGFFDAATTYRLVMKPTKHTFHPKLKNIPVYAYNGITPGPIIEAKVSKPVRVEWFNGLTNTNLEAVLELGQRLGMEEDHMLVLPHNGVHLHGARVPWTSDGHPHHIYHPGEGRKFLYPNKQAAATLWYHDHTMDVTRLNVYAGLFGLYFLRAPDELAKLPKGELEIPLLLQDKSFSTNGKKLYYEQSVDPDPVPEFAGDHPVVNGKIWPVTTLRPRVYRLRLCNGANARFFDLSLVHENDPTEVVPLNVIGTEGGFLPAAESVMKLMIAPGERYDVLVDLRNKPGKSFILKNAADPGGLCEDLLKIKVNGTKVSADKRFVTPLLKLPKRNDPMPSGLDRTDYAAIDAAINAVPMGAQPFDPGAPTTLNVAGKSIKLRRFLLEEYDLVMPTYPNPVPTVLINGKDWHSAPAFNVALNDFEVWEFFNITPDPHPMHVHLVQFQLMSRVPFASTGTGPATVTGYTGAGAAIPAHEQGWKDTAICPVGSATRIIMKFDGFRGQYVYHCHILEHEDMGMMFQFNVD